MTTWAVLLTGAPGAGKSSVLEELATLLEIDGVEFGALESEQLGWGLPWLSGEPWLNQLRAVLDLQRQAGRRRFLLAATTETSDELAAVRDAIAVDQLVSVLAGVWLLNRALLMRQRVQKQMHGIAHTYALSSLPNRRAWDESLPRELARARRDGQPLTVAMIDLDNFKRFNDTRGHQAGDQLLASAASAWGSQLRETDLLARYGGEEFTVALPQCSAAAAEEVLSRLHREVPDGQTCSIGSATWDRQEDGDALVSRADNALYEAKRAGRNRTVSAPAPNARGMAEAGDDLSPG